jgi:hypothetical protein
MLQPDPYHPWQSPGDASRHLPHNVNKREIARVKKCEPVPKPNRS